ncbi:unnamed protein product, partial [marine sediment metagenome]
NKNKQEILDVNSYYIDKCRMMLFDINRFNPDIETKIINGSMINNNNYNLIKNNSVGITIFSPPYANCFDYCEVYKMEIWMGEFVFSYDDFWKYRSIAVRSHVNAKFDHTIKNSNNSVNVIADLISCFNVWNKNIPDMVRGYFDDMANFFIKFKEIMIPGSKCYIVVANSGYRGVIVPTDLLLAEVAEKLGMEVEKIVYARKIRASSQQMEELHNDYENLMRESVITLQVR